MVSLLSEEVRARLNLAPVCQNLYEVASALGFRWADETTDFRKTFRARVFDNRRTFLRRGNDESGMMNDELKTALHSSFITHHSSFDDDDAPPPFVRVESAARFGAEIPLEYAYAAWGLLRETGARAQVRGFAGVTSEQLRDFARAHARHAARRGELRLQEQTGQEGAARPLAPGRGRGRPNGGAAQPLARRFPPARTPRVVSGEDAPPRAPAARARRDGPDGRPALRALREGRRARGARLVRLRRRRDGRGSFRTGAGAAAPARGRLGRAQPGGRRRRAPAPRASAHHGTARGGRRGLGARGLLAPAVDDVQELAFQVQARAVRARGRRALHGRRDGRRPQLRQGPRRLPQRAPQPPLPLAERARRRQAPARRPPQTPARRAGGRATRCPKGAGACCRTATRG
jgi:hypothetical protein